MEGGPFQPVERTGLVVDEGTFLEHGEIRVPARGDGALGVEPEEARRAGAELLGGEPRGVEPARLGKGVEERQQRLQPRHAGARIEN